jgi:uncharacterized membrane protein (UPF0127 family)
MDRGIARTFAVQAVEAACGKQTKGRDKMAQQTYCAFNQTRESFVSLSIALADTHLLRLKGLLGRISLRSDEGLWMVPSQGIHTIGLLFPIDLVYLDASFRVIHLIEHLGPFRIAPIRLQSASVLELPTHTIYSSQTQIGDQVLIYSQEEMHTHLKENEANSVRAVEQG